MSEARSFSNLRGAYFRFSPEAGGDLGLAEYKERPTMDALVVQYLSDGLRRQLVDECCAQVRPLIQTVAD
jgi:hypothetical protein